MTSLEEGLGFCDESTLALVLKGINNKLKIRDTSFMAIVIYGLLLDEEIRIRGTK